ncbi:MAG: hypothetical protein WA364_17930 [Candidatus Nitrosopolaris sp.]
MTGDLEVIIQVYGFNNAMIMVDVRLILPSFANSFYGTLHQTYFLYRLSSRFSFVTDLSNIGKIKNLKMIIGRNRLAELFTLLL